MPRDEARDFTSAERERNQLSAFGRLQNSGLRRGPGGRGGRATGRVGETPQGSNAAVQIEHVTLQAVAGQTIAAGGGTVLFDRIAAAPTERRGFRKAAAAIVADGSVGAIPVDVTGDLEITLKGKWGDYPDGFKGSGDLVITRSRPGSGTASKTVTLFPATRVIEPPNKIGWSVRNGDTITMSLPNDSGEDQTLTELEVRLRVIATASPTSPPEVEPIPDLVWRFDASDVDDGGRGPTPSDGGDLQQWSDLSDNQVDFVNPASPYASGPPSWHSGGGTPYVHFERGENLPMATDAGPQPLSALAATAGTIIWVVRCAADPPTNKYSGPLNALSNVGFHFYPAGGGHISHTQGHIYSDLGSGTRDLGNPSQDLSQVHIFTALSAPDHFEAWINGASIYSDGSNTVTWSSNTGLTRPRMGISYDDAGAHRWEGDIFEIRVYARELTATERTQVVNELSSKWGVS